MRTRDCQIYTLKFSRAMQLLDNSDYNSPTNTVAVHIVKQLHCILLLFCYANINCIRCKEVLYPQKWPGDLPIITTYSRDAHCKIPRCLVLAPTHCMHDPCGAAVKDRNLAETLKVLFTYMLHWDIIHDNLFIAMATGNEIMGLINTEQSRSTIILYLLHQ